MNKFSLKCCAAAFCLTFVHYCEGVAANKDSLAEEEVPIRHTSIDEALIEKLNEITHHDEFHKLAISMREKFSFLDTMWKIPVSIFFRNFSIFGDRAEKIATDGMPFSRTAGIIWNRSYKFEEDNTVLFQEKPIMVTATFVDPLSFGFKNSCFQNRLLLACAHFMPEVDESLKSTHFESDEFGIFSVGDRKFNLSFSFQNTNPGRFGISGTRVKHILLPDNSALTDSNYIDIAFLVLESPVLSARPVIFAPVLNVSDDESVPVSGASFYGFGAGIPIFKTPQLKHEYPSVRASDISLSVPVKLISNTEEIEMYDKKVKLTGWQVLKRRALNGCMLNSSDNPSISDFMTTFYFPDSSSKIGPGDSGGGIIMPTGECSGVITTNLTAVMLTDKGLSHFGSILSTI